jgi:hypothetical protein
MADAGCTRHSSSIVRAKSKGDSKDAEAGREHDVCGRALR